MLPRLGASSSEKKGIILPTEPRGVPFKGAFEPLEEELPRPATLGSGACFAPGGCHVDSAFCCAVPGTKSGGRLFGAIGGSDTTFRLGKSSFGGTGARGIGGGL